MGAPIGPLPHQATHTTGQADPFLSTDVLEAVVKRLQESGGPTTLLMGSVPDTQLLQRSGTSIVGTAANGVGKASKGFVYGLLPTWLSATTIRVGNGACRDSADAADMTLSLVLGSELVGDISTEAAALGVDVKTSAATLTPTNATPAFVTSSNIVPELGTRALTHTSFSAAGTVVTGVGTRFLTEVAVGDLVGSNTVGYSRVMSIQSDTSLTLPTGQAFGAAGGSTGLVLIENASLLAVTDGSRRLIANIASTGLSGAILNPSTFVSSTAQALKLGVRTSADQQWFYLWLGSGGSGTTIFFSTQRTASYGITGYTTSVRRIGTVNCDTSGNILKFYCSPIGWSRWFAYDDGGGATTRILSAGTATAWAKFNGASFVPPAGVAPWVYLLGTVVQGVAPNTSVRYRENASAGTSGFIYALSETVNVANVVYNWGSNLGQGFEYQLDAAGSTTTAYCGVMAYVDALA